VLDAHLAKNQFLGAKELSVSDIVIAVQLRYPFTLLFDEATRSAVPHLTKWFTSIMELETCRNFFGKTWLCQKEFTPDFEFANKKKE